MFKSFILSSAKYMIILAALVVLLALNWKMWSKAHYNEKTLGELQQELAHQQKENRAMIDKNTELRQHIDSLKRGSSQMIEEQARDSFGMVGEGETFFEFKSSADRK